MKKYHRDAFFDLRTSINKDVAISILLGLRSFDPVQPNHNPMGDPHAEHQKYLDGLDISIFDFISDMRSDAQHEMDDAIWEKNQVKKAECKMRVLRCDELTRSAHRHLCDINYELAKSEQSILKLDLVATKTPGEPHIEIASLDAWWKDRGNGSIYSITPYLAAFGDKKVDLSAEQGESCVEVEAGNVLTDNLYVSFAILVEAFSKTATAYHSENGPTVIAIAKRIETLAKEANGGKDYLPGQRHGAIKLKIVEAMKRKRAKLPRN
jgi:hypothetical protein